MKTNNKGFSLVELIVVIAIMAILAAVAIPTFASFITKANKAADDDFLNQVEYAIDLANIKDTEFDAGDITVTWTSDNRAGSYEYPTGTTVNLTSASDNEASDVIDWDYDFKYYKSGVKINDGVITPVED